MTQTRNECNIKQKNTFVNLKVDGAHIIVHFCLCNNYRLIYLIVAKRYSCVR